MNKDIISIIGEFLNPNQCFLYSIVCKEWNKGLIIRKKYIVEKNPKSYVQSRLN